MKRALLVVPSLAVAACTLFSPLDYLSNGEPLTDGGAAADGGGEAGITADVFASAQAVPDRVALDATDVYWHAAGNGQILAAPKAGGAPRAIAQAVPTVSAFVVDPASGGAVYWATDTDVFRASKQGDGGAGERVLAAPGTVVAIAVDDTSLWIALSVDSPSGTIVRVPKSGGATTPIESADDPFGLAVDATSIVWVDNTSSSVRILPRAAAADGGLDGGGSAAATVVGGASDPIAPSDPDQFLLGPDAFYWSELATDSTYVYRHVRDGASRTTLWIGEATADIGGMALDDRFVWFTETTTKSLLRVPKQGGDAVVATAGVAGLGGVVSDGTNVYFTSKGTSGTAGAILRVPAR